MLAAVVGVGVAVVARIRRDRSRSAARESGACRHVGGVDRRPVRDHPRRRPVARDPHPRRRATRRGAVGIGHAGRVVPVQRLPRIDAPPEGESGCDRGHRDLGHRRGCTRLVVGSRPVHDELETRLAACAAPKQPSCSPPATPRTSACWPHSAETACASAPTSSTMRRSSTAAGWLRNAAPTCGAPSVTSMPSTTH